MADGRRWCAGILDSPCRRRGRGGSHVSPLQLHMQPDAVGKRLHVRTSRAARAGSSITAIAATSMFLFLARPPESSPEAVWRRGVQGGVLGFAEWRLCTGRKGELPTEEGGDRGSQRRGVPRGRSLVKHGPVRLDFQWASAHVARGRSGRWSGRRQLYHVSMDPCSPLSGFPLG